MIITNDSTKKQKPRDEFGELLTDQWETPWPVFNELILLFGLPNPPNIDAFASANNKKCPLFVDRAMDANKIDLIEFAKQNNVEPYFFGNPPYSREGDLGKCVRTMYYTAKRGAVFLAIISVSTSPVWWHECVEPLPNTHKKFLKGRRKFKAPPGMIDPERPSGDSVALLFAPRVCK